MILTVRYCTILG